MVFVVISFFLNNTDRDKLVKSLLVKMKFMRLVEYNETRTQQGNFSDIKQKSNCIDLLKVVKRNLESFRRYQVNKN